ncbi:MAG TPA: tetratricopeptide repeat protein [Myxococcales bacterium]|nr:tetratricopeptide repeat protein [Myxococcales bacterium]
MIALLAVLLAAAAAEPGKKLLQQGRPAEAANALAAALRKDPRNAAFANDLGIANARAGRPAEAEQAYRLAIQLGPRRWAPYANLAELLSTLPDRWDRADEILALLERGLSRTSPPGRINLALRVADFERSVGRTSQARQRLAALDETKLDAAQLPRARELLERIADDERARGFEDWPEAAPSPDQLAALAAAEQKLAANDPRGALAEVSALCAAQPAWRAAHRLRARCLEATGQLDEEARELRILTQLAPADAAAWRRLGRILTEHGGLLEANRADAALREALALEPSWTELWLLRARVALRLGRPQDAVRHLDRYGRGGGGDAEASRLAAAAAAQTGGDAQPPARGSGAKEPSANARILYQQAGTADSPESSRRLLEQALEDSPAFVEAAAALFSVSGAVPERTLDALRDDGTALLELAARVRRAGGSPALVAPWVDRAVETAAPEARFVRAQLRLEQGNRAGAIQDLLTYAASPDPQHLDEARLLRSQVLTASHTDLALLQARRRLAEDRPEAALAVIGDRCEAGVDTDRLLAIGEIREFSGELPQALECYRLAAPAPAALRRLARVAGRAPDARAEPELRAAAAQGIPEALWALAQIELARGRQEAALEQAERFLSAAAPDDPGVPGARAVRDSLLRSSREAAQARARKQAALWGGGGVFLSALAAWLWAGATLQSALRRAPRLFPHVARAIHEVRHDVIKHRAGTLAMAAEPGARREDIARALLAPEPASKIVARHYEALRTAARSLGVRLRRISREPLFGPLVRDLARAEALLRDPSADARELQAIDARVRGDHSRRLAGLLRLGPRTKLDARALAGWIHAVEAEMRRGGSSWTAPSILIQGMEVEFPVEKGALSTIFANLLRNAQAAAEGGEVIVRLGEERDGAGRNLTVLLVGDSSTHAISLEAIEQRESGRGLALARDLTREWQGHMVVRPEEPPWTKAVGACFPAPPA